MSKYTTEVRFICEANAGLPASVGEMQVEDMIQSAIPKIFNFKYPIFDESYKNVLETKILRHYYTREIAFETVGLWKLKLNTKLNEIMPYYNQLYKSELLEFNPFYDTEITRKREAENKKNEETNTSNNSTSSNKSDVTKKDIGSQSTTNEESYESNLESENNVDTTTNQKVIESGKNDLTKGTTSTDTYSDTPQGSLQNLDNSSYLSNARKIIDSGVDSTVKENNSETDSSNKIVGNDNAKSDGSREVIIDTNDERNVTENRTGSATSGIIGNVIGDMTSIEEFLESVKGKQSGKSYSELLNEFRSTFLNIDMLVIDELGDLFFTLW